MPTRKTKDTRPRSQRETVLVTVRLKNTTVEQLREKEPGTKISTLLRELAEEYASGEA